MTTTMRGRLMAAALMLLSVGPALAAQRSSQLALLHPQPFAWWKSEQFKKELGLTADQSARIDKIYETARPELRQEWDELSRLEEKLSRMIQNDADEAILSRQIDRVETARANANKTRALMLVQMFKTLTPDQRARFKTLNDRWQQDFQRRPPADPHKPREH